MEKLSLIIVMLFVLLLVGCTNNKNEVQNSSEPFQQMIGEISKSEIEENEEIKEDIIEKQEVSGDETSTPFQALTEENIELIK